MQVESVLLASMLGTAVSAGLAYPQLYSDMLEELRGVSGGAVSVVGRVVPVPPAVDPDDRAAVAPAALASAGAHHVEEPVRVAPPEPAAPALAPVEHGRAGFPDDPADAASAVDDPTGGAGAQELEIEREIPEGQELRADAERPEGGEVQERGDARFVDPTRDVANDGDWGADPWADGE